jgi:hypothetical protein
MQTIQRPSATVSRLLQSAQVPDVPGQVLSSIAP